MRITFLSTRKRKVAFWSVLVIFGYALLCIVVSQARPDYSNLDDSQNLSEPISTSRKLGDFIPSIGGDVPLIPTPTPEATPNTYFPTPVATPTPTPTPNIVNIPTPNPEAISTPTPTPAPTASASNSGITASPTPTSAKTVKTSPTPANVTSSSAPTTSPSLSSEAEKVISITDDYEVSPSLTTSEENLVVPASLTGGLKIEDDFDDFAVALADGLQIINEKKGSNKKAYEIDPNTGDFVDQSVYNNPLYLTAMYGESKKLSDNLVNYYDKCIAVDGASADCSGFTYLSTCSDGCQEQVKLADEDLVDTQEWLNNRMDFLSQSYNQVIESDLNWENNQQVVFSDSGQKLDLGLIPNYNSASLYEMTNPASYSKAELLKDLEETNAKLEEIKEYEATSVSGGIENSDSSLRLSVPNNNLSRSILTVESKYPTVGAMAKAKNKYTWKSKVDSDELNYQNSKIGKVAGFVLAPVKLASNIVYSTQKLLSSSIVHSTSKSKVCSKKAKNTVKVPRTKGQVFYDEYGKSVVVLKPNDDLAGAKGAIRDSVEGEGRRSLSRDYSSRNANAKVRESRLVTLRTNTDGTPPDQMLAKDVLTIGQKDYANISYSSSAHPDATISSGGCGVVSAAIAIGNIYQGIVPDSLIPEAKDALVKQIRDAAVKNGDRGAEGTYKTLFTETLPSLYDVKAIELGKQSRSVILGYLSNNIPVIMNGVGDAPFTKSGHYVVAISGARVKNSQGVMEDYIYISDPKDGQVKMYRYDDFADRIVKDKLIAIVPNSYKISVNKQK